jgi:hypothetical protein
MAEVGYPVEVQMPANGNAYPKTRGNEDYGPSHKLLSLHSLRLIRALQLPPAQEEALLKVVQCYIDLDQLMKRDGCYTDAEKERCACLGSQLILQYLAAGAQRKDLNCYMLMCLFLGDFQPSESNLCYLRLGHCRHCPKGWNVLKRHCNMKAADDEGIENGHRVWKQENTHNGGGRFVQHPDTCPEDKMTNDRLGLDLRLQMTEVRLDEGARQKVLIAGHTRSAPYRSRKVEGGLGSATVKEVLEQYWEMGLQFQTAAQLTASGQMSHYLELRGQCCNDTGLTEGQVESWLSSKAAGRAPYQAHPHMLLPQQVCAVRPKVSLADFCSKQQEPKRKKARTETTVGQRLQQPAHQQQRGPGQQQQTKKGRKAASKGTGEGAASKKARNNPRRKPS